MSYYIRLLSPREGVPVAGDVERWLSAEGFPAALTAEPADDDWNRLDVIPPGRETLVATRSLRQGEENPVDDEVDSFLDVLLEVDDTPALRQVEDGLRAARQMITLEVPDSFPWGEERTVVDALVEFLADRTEALIQADGEGFYDRDGELLVAVEQE